MARLSKRMSAIREKIDSAKLYTPQEAFDLLKELSSVKFEESVDASFNLGVDPKKSDQVVRRSVLLPHGTGKSVRVAVFTQGENAEKAKAAGADIVGMDDLAAEVKKGNMDFDVVIASPDAMRVVGQLGQILGPRGLMPNPKLGTVTPDVAKAVVEQKAGKVEYRTEKNGIVHVPIGKRSFTEEQIKQNFDAILSAIIKAKPSTSKGTYLRSLTISTTMGPGIKVDTVEAVNIAN